MKRCTLALAFVAALVLGCEDPATVVPTSTPSAAATATWTAAPISTSPTATTSPTGTPSPSPSPVATAAPKAAPAASATAAVTAAPTTTPSRANCSPSYPTVCIPPAPPDLDCGQITFRRFQVLPPDPHRFDGDRDGIGCE